MQDATRERIGRTVLLALFVAVPLLCAGAELGDELLAATRKGDIAAVKKLLDQGADVNSKSPYGSTALFFAADRGHTEIAKLLLERGADPNVKDTFYNTTALTWAAEKGRVEIVKMLLAKGAEGVDGLLGSAAQSGDKELIRIALDTGKVKQNTLNYALSVVIKAKKDDLVEMLKKAGAQPPAAATATVPTETLASYVGRYQGGRGGTEMEFDIALKDGKLSLSNPAGGNPLTLAPLSTTRFRGVEFDQVEVEFKVEGGKTPGMDIVQGGNTMPFTRKESK